MPAPPQAAPPGQIGVSFDAGRPGSHGQSRPVLPSFPRLVRSQLGWRRRPAHDRDRLAMAAVTAVALVGYLTSLLPGVGYSGDVAKFQMLGAVGGIPHATGYPLYVALLQAFHDLVPLGSSAWRANLLSALLATGAMVLLFQLLRLLDVRRPVAVAATLTFAFTATFWTHAVVAEVYALHLLLTLAVTGCLVRWRLGAANANTNANKWLLAGLGLYALSFGHHLTTGLALPAVAWLVLSDWRRALTARNVAFVTVAVAAGASQYLYLLRMNAVGGYREFPVDDLAAIVDYVTGGPFRKDMFVFTPGELITERLPLIVDFVRHEYGTTLLPLLVYGVVRALRRPRHEHRVVFVHLLLLAAADAFYAANFDVSDVVVFCLPAFLALSVFLAIGLDDGAAWLSARLRARRPQSPRLALAPLVAVAALPLASFLVHHEEANQRDNTDDRDRIEQGLAVAGSHALLLTDSYADAEYLWYYTVGEGLREERDLVVSPFTSPAAVARYFAGRPGKLSHDAAYLDEPDQARLYTVSATQAAAVRQAGLRVTAVADDVWEIRAPAAG